METAEMDAIASYEDIIYTFTNSLIAAKMKPTPGVLMETAIIMLDNITNKSAVIDGLIHIINTCQAKYSDIIARCYVQSELVNALVSVGFSKLVLQPGIDFKISSGDIYTVSKLIATYAPHVKALDRAAYEIVNNFPVMSILSVELILFLFNYASLYGEVPKTLMPIISDALFIYTNISNIHVLMSTLSKHAVWWYCNVAHSLAPNIEQIERAYPKITLSAWICIQYMRHLLVIGGAEADIIARFHWLAGDSTTLRAIVIKMLKWANDPANVDDVRINRTILGIASKHSIK